MPPPVIVGALGTTDTTVKLVTVTKYSLFANGVTDGVAKVADVLDVAPGKKLLIAIGGVPLANPVLVSFASKFAADKTLIGCVASVPLAPSCCSKGAPLVLI